MSEEARKTGGSFAGNNGIFTLMMAAVVAMMVAIGAVGVAAVAGGSSSESAAADATTTVNVTLTEFAVDFSPTAVAPGNVVLNITNAGSAIHNLVVPSIDKRIDDIPAGASVLLDLGYVDEDLEMICEIPGHLEAGMKNTLKVDAEAAALLSGGTPDAPLTNDQMDRIMEEVAMRFLDQLQAPVTEGIGNQELAPTIVDGVKVFDLTASVIDWEVEPGKWVKAWAYNGQVPGPILRADVGDRIRINLKNELAESTSLHLHGVRVPNSLDGVDPYTQPATKPGKSFTYEWTAVEPAVGMYHSHHNAQVQIPNGLAGALLIGDWKDMAMKKAMSFDPGRLEDRDGKAEQEVVMVLNDSGTIGLSLNGKSFPATQAYVMKKGETMVVHYYNEGLTPHPMHMHQPHGLVVARDGVIMESPFWTDTINVAPGERWTVVYNMKDVGAWAWHCHILTHAETPQGMKYMVTAVIVE